MDRKLKMGMVGGGRGAFIGSVHRMAAQLDGKIELVCGAFSADPEKSRQSGADLFLPGNRVYASYGEMLAAESRLPLGERMDFVSIVTPNNTHYPVAVAALEAGFDVVCDKPMTLTLDEAVRLREKVRASGRLFCLTHNYTGYPMVKQAREMIQAGSLGSLRRVVVEYPQGWVATALEKEGQKQAAWRTDPSRSGASFTMGDIGTHCANLAEYITGQRIAEVCAEINTFVPGRPLDDDGSVLLHFDGGARGVLWASGIAVGEENGLNIRIYGEKGAVKWRQEEPNTLTLLWLDRPVEHLRTATGFIGPAAAGNSRLPAGHPEGFIEAFANLYRCFADALAAKLDGRLPDSAGLDFPGIDEGVRGMAFIEAVVASSRAGQKWIGI